jgi:Flp pilus assembly protein TadG
MTPRWRQARHFLRSARSGASALEFAIVAPALLLLAIGIIECGRLVWTAEALQQSASETARCMGILASGCTSGGGYSSTQTLSYLQGTATGWGVSLPSGDVTLSSSGSCGGASGFSTVVVAYTFHTAVPNLITPFANGITLNISACFPNQPTS